MATYDNILQYIRQHHRKWVHTCWIAHVKEINGLTTRRAPNRLPGRTRQNKCPSWARPLIEDALRYYKMI
jgi:hypothetical protein